VHCAEPSHIIETIRTKCPLGRVDIVSVYATLEHQTLRERQATLKVSWELLREGGVMVVGQTPNLLTYFHPHTSRVPFFDMLPDEMKWMYLDHMPSSNFVDRMKDWAAKDPTVAAERLTRWGRGVSFHDFEVAFGDIHEAVIGHGFEPEMLKINPLELEELLLLTYILEKKLPIPIGFARRWLSLVIQKPGPGVKPLPPQFDPKFLSPPLVLREAFAKSATPDLAPNN
jgi:hypothetical protein